MIRRSAWVACLLFVLFAGMEMAAGLDSPEEAFEAAGKAFASGDIDQALALFDEAATQGYVPAMTALGLMHQLSLAGDKSDMALAVKWLSAAAEKGDSTAKVTLADMYFSGDGVPQDERRAYDLYLSAAKQGHHLAMWHLAFLHRNGQAGLERNTVEGFKWLLLSRKYAVKAGKKKGEDLANHFIEDWSAQMTGEEIAEAQALADSWQP